jgi:hypothetical protein
MSATTAETELPTIANLTAEQKKRLLALLIKDELDRQPIPMPIQVKLDEEDLGQFRPRIKRPAQTTLPAVPDSYWDEAIQYAKNPGKTLTTDEALRRDPMEDISGQ